MPIMATAQSESGKTFEPAPAGVHLAVCVDVVDLGWLEVMWQGLKKTQHKVNIAWQIAESRDDGKPFLVFKRYTLSLHEKSALSHDMEGWRGKKFTEAERRGGWDVESIIGKCCLLNVTHNEASNGKTYANIASIMPLPKGMPGMTARDYVRKQDRDKVPVDAGHDAPPKEWDEAPPLTDDDIPFAWLMPLVLPVLGVLGGSVALIS